MITDLEKQLADNNIKEVTKVSLAGDVGFFVRRVLEGLGAICTPHSLISAAAQSAMIGEPEVFTGTAQKVTMDFLKQLPDEYFGRAVNLAHESYRMIPFSLEKYEGRIYAQVHLSREEFSDG